MNRPSSKLFLWTERLGEDGYFRQTGTGRLERGAFSLPEILSLMERVRELNGPELDAILFLKGSGRSLEIKVRAEGLEISDPEDPNYQNIPLRFGEAAEFMRSRFLGTEDDQAVVHHPSSGTRMAIFAGLTLLFMAALFFLVNHLGKESGFLPVVKVQELEDPKEVDRLLHRFHGVYSTPISDGAMLIELQEDGYFVYADLHTLGQGVFRAESVTTGTYRPVYESGQLALLTDSRFLIHPGDEALNFQGRVYVRLGKARNEIPYLVFHD